jgi:hypothetical protein
VTKGQMHEFTPVVYWLFQTAEPFDVALEGLLHDFHARAKVLVHKRSLEERSGRDDPRSLIVLALHSLQRRILDQYLPVLAPSKSERAPVLPPS